MLTLYIGNKRYSSWSLRPWLALRWGGIAFEERLLPLGQEGHGTGQNKDILAVSPSGRLPCLNADGVAIYESLAICEWAAERTPSLWPADERARALARSAAAEMHAGFADLRRAMPFNLGRRMARAPDWDDAVRRDLTRIVSLWADLRARFGAGGPFLFGTRTIADAFYAPVAGRFRTYAVELSPPAQAYCDAIFADTDFQAWERAARLETWALPTTDGLYP